MFTGRSEMLAKFQAAGAAAAEKSSERADVPEKYKWNTSDIYHSDAAWHDHFKSVSARIPGLAAFQGTMGRSAADFFDAIDTITSVDMDLSRLHTYAFMRSDEDTRAAEYRGMRQSSQDIVVQYYAAISFFQPAVLALGEKKVRAFVKEDKRLAPYVPVLEDILRYAEHTLSAAEEKIAAQASMMSDAPASAYGIFTNADLPYPEAVLSDGKKIKLEPAAYSQHRASPVRADRELVFKTFWTRYKEFERTLGTTLNGHVKTHMFNREVHKFGSCLDAALFDANVPSAVYKQLIADVHSNLPTLHRYLRLRKKMMGLDSLGYEDLYAPIVKEVESLYTPEQATDLVLEAVAPLGPGYVADLKAGFENRWVDFMPSTGKRSGAYSTGVYGVHPYQLQNFTGQYEEVSTLAHECGHSMHTFLSDRNQPYCTHSYKIFVAEVASTLNENLLLNLMLGKTKDKDTRLFLLGTHLDGLRTTLFRQTLFAEFELRIHEMAEKGEPLTGERFSQIYLALLKEYYGDSLGVCSINDLYGIEWAYIPHFYYNFYVYQYATSIMASSMIASRILAGQPGAQADYLRMLSSGASKYPIELMKDAGVDMTTSEPFSAAMKEMNSVMDEMEKLLKA